MTDHDENIESDGPEEAEAYVEETDEEGEVTAMTGVVPPGAAAASAGTHSGGGTYRPGGMVISGTGAGTWTIPSGGTITTSGSIHTTPKRADAFVAMPPKITRKMLVAFLDEHEKDEDKNVDWAAVLRVVDVSFDYEGGEGYINVKLSLRDEYGNNKK